MQSSSILYTNIQRESSEVEEQDDVMIICQVVILRQQNYPSHT